MKKKEIQDMTRAELIKYVGHLLGMIRTLQAANQKKNAKTEGPPTQDSNETNQ